MEEASDRSQISHRMQPNPVSIKAWASLTEERHERARSKGQFDNLRGRGKPFVRDANEANPFIPTEEFLMNRIIQRNGAAPPWIEIQQEMDASLSAFRRSLQASWVRRVIRALTVDRPPSALVGLSEAAIASIRDPEWESREVMYHEYALNEVNSLIRKYNNAAPYTVRKPYLQLRPELDGCFELAAPRIMEELAARAREPGGDNLAHSPCPGQPSSLSACGGSDPHNQVGQRIGHEWSLVEMVRRWLLYSSVKV
ncbi:hypothetical protein BS47DRAFT_1340417 [Hydnum rufescens UP504]|uniref:DnaJ homologue subfamily C member 28 conserved domain-containing protein n=1 Tax=Hydnum rufescens UP504 TaxID=1448309 RepID=A0A9P6B304_9AGAM|nr:hypothetical protein BS47DRAFT_1340417 [Hydnum rufescens UP504]